MGTAVKVTGVFSRLNMPHRLKGGRIEKIADYFKNVLDDYVTVAKETLSDMKDRPLKSTFYSSLLTGAVVLIKTNPSESDLTTRLIEHSEELLLLSDLTRNPNSEKFVKNVMKLKTEGRLKYRNLLLCSLLCETNYNTDLGMYEAKCKYVKPHWTEFHKTIVDVGVLGKWRNLEAAMKDYDVNSEEWNEDGTANPNFAFNKQSLVSWDMKM